ncbi:MAG: GspE/PulE family protein [Verrucomicrobiales bacterium]|nr:GspE/PulE family protein [Verrucomicrobiales bacterium]
MNQIDVIFSDAANSRATDIHIDPVMDGYQIRYRIDGKLRLNRNLKKSAGISLINQIKAAAGIEPGTAFLPKDERIKLSISGRSLDLRITLVPCISGPKIAIRLLDPNNVIREIPQLGLQPEDRTALEEWTRSLNGMILVTGPTSSGKTTTLYSLLYEIAEESRHVVTVEDPVEYEIDGINQIQVDNRHNLDFAEGVKTALRLDPDCVMVGEIRAHDAAFEAVNAAVQGHVVMATLHSRDMVSAVTRLRNYDIENHQITTALGVVVNQRLVRKLCDHCRKKGEVTESTKTFFESNRVSIPETLFLPVGCEHCANSGYFGRTGIFEIWNLDVSDYELILANQDEKAIRNKLKNDNHTFILHDAAKKLADGTTSFDEIKVLGLDLPWTTGRASP